MYYRKIVNYGWVPSYCVEQQCHIFVGNSVIFLILTLFLVPFLGSSLYMHSHVWASWGQGPCALHLWVFGTQQSSWHGESVCWVNFNWIMFLLLGLGLTQYFSEALTWFWESSLLIKYSGKFTSRDVLLYVYKSQCSSAHWPFLGLNIGNSWVCSVYLEQKCLTQIIPRSNMEGCKVRQVLFGSNSIPCHLSELQ